jgi:prevent-host-death family protein
MPVVNLKEARRRLTALVDAAEHGESTVITRRGRRVARLVPAAPPRSEPLPDLTEFRSSIRRRGNTLTQALLASRREERA